MHVETRDDGPYTYFSGVYLLHCLVGSRQCNQREGKQQRRTLYPLAINAYDTVSVSSVQWKRGKLMMRTGPEEARTLRIRGNAVATARTTLFRGSKLEGGTHVSALLYDATTQPRLVSPIAEAAIADSSACCCQLEATIGGCDGHTTPGEARVK